MDSYPGKITIICIAPLTTLSILLQIHPDLSNKVRSVFVLAGSLSGKREFNLGYDPEAAYMVLTKLSNVFVLPIDIADRYSVSYSTLRTWLQQSSYCSLFMKETASWIIRNKQIGIRTHQYYFPDTLTVYAALHPAAITKCIHLPIDKIFGPFYQELLFDRENNPANFARIILELDVKLLWNQLSALFIDTKP